MAHNVSTEVKLEPGELERHLGVELSRTGMARSETVSISALWLRRIGNKAQVLVEVKTPARGRGWYLVLEEQFDGNFSHIAEVGGILDSPEDPLTNSAEKGKP